MTKREEIQVLRNAIASLGTNSYCGPWLASVVDEVESIVRSDYFPMMTIADTQKEINTRLVVAAENAKGIIEVATADAKKISDRAARYQDSVAEALRLALRNLNNV